MTVSMIDAGQIDAERIDGERSRAEGPTAVDAAVRFVALQPGGAGKILREHDRRDDGTCGGCLTSPVTWPCVVSVIATKAQELDAAR